MSMLFPAIPKHAGPFLLKEFLQRYFFLHLQIDDTAHDTFSSSFSRVSERFEVLVYVLLSAPPPPSVIMNPSLSTAEIVTEMTEARVRVEAPYGRPLTASVLRHPFWNALFAQLGPTAVGFIVSWCPTVVQFESSGGGLQVLGPPLKNAVLPAMKRCRQADWVKSRKAARLETTCASFKTAKKVDPSLRSSLYRLNVSLCSIIGEPPQRTFAESEDRLVDTILAELWRWPRKTTESTTRRCVVVDGDPHASRSCAEDCAIWKAARALRELVFPYTLSHNNHAVRANDFHLKKNETSMVERHLEHILHCVLSNVSRMNPRGAAIKHIGYIEARSGNLSVGPNASSVSDLMAPVPVVVSYIRTLFASMRWCAPGKEGPYAHFWGNSNQSEINYSPITTDKGNNSTARDNHRNNDKNDNNKEGKDEDVLTHVCSTMRDWFCCGRHGAFMLSHFLHEVRVAKLPWLSGFYTTCPGGRKRRSLLQQRVFLELVFFLLQHIVPRLVRRSFHVTWSTKNPSVFVYVPKSAWMLLVRRELRRACARRKRRRCVRQDTHSTDADSVLNVDKVEEGRCASPWLPPMTLRRVTSPESVLSRTLPPAMVGAPIADGPMTLYSSLRFLPDQRKLRPIAFIRLAPNDAMARLALPRPPRPPKRPEQQPQQAWPPLESFGSLSSPLASLRPHMGGLGRHLRQPSWSRPNTTLLRTALRCLLAGAAAEQTRMGFTPRMNASHENEYMEIRCFIESARRFCASPERCATPVPGTCAPGIVQTTILRGDASRCYDRLPQSAVMEAVHRLTPHAVYRTLRFTPIAPIAGMLRYQSVQMRTIPAEDLQTGILHGIPRGVIFCEEQVPADGGVVRGDDVRLVLEQHLCCHLVVVGGRLYMQRAGIQQGSAVAMLLCDTLLETVDASLAELLAQHEEPALLLRRVDDIIVLTLSHAAADRCHAALRGGWPSVGFKCQTEKLQRTADTPVPWCGLLWDPRRLQVSVEWHRLTALLPHLGVRPRTGNEPLHSSTRFFGILRLRTPMTVFCRRINSKTRVVQTIYEMGLLWARFYLYKLMENAYFVRPHLGTLMRPLHTTVTQLQRFVRRKSAALRSVNSFCDVKASEVRLCFLVALHRTLQRRLRHMVRQCGRTKCGGIRSVLPLFAAVVRCRMDVALAAAVAVVKEDSRFPRNADEESTAALLLTEGSESVSALALAAVRDV